MKTFRTLLCAAIVAVVAASPALGAGELFLRLEGIQGDSTATGHVGDIDVQSLAFGVNQTGIREAGGRASARRSSLSTINIAKFVDKSSPKLFIACALGTTIPNATITLRKAAAGAVPLEFLVIKLENVLVSSVSVGGSEGGQPTESISLSFSKITYIYTPQNAEGQPLPPIVVTFDVFANKAFSPPQ